MKRADLEHILRTAGTLARVKQLVIVGSQAILGKHPDAPAELLKSQELDTYPLDDPEKADLIDGSIGEMSPFHAEFGYFAHGVGPETAVLPRGWKKRLVKVRNRNTGGVTGLCLAPLDLAVSKLVAGRDKDIRFVSAMLKHRLALRDAIAKRIAELPRSHVAVARASLVRCRP